MVTNAEIDALVSAGRFREAASRLARLDHPSTSQQVLRAHLCHETEGPVAAAAHATALMDFRLTKADRARCLEILGCASAASGDLSTGLRLLEQALALAIDDRVQRARLELRVINSLLNWIGIEPALARLPRVKQAVIRSGDPPSAIALRLICAEIEMKRSNHASAELHLATASALFGGFPHGAHEARLMQLQSNQAALQSRFREAFDLAEASLRKSEDAGWSQGVTAALANIAHFGVVTGDLVRARECLYQARQRVGSRAPVGVCIASTEVELTLAEGDVAAAADLAQSLYPSAQELQGGHSFYALWFEASRVHALTKVGRVAEATRIANDALPYVDRLGDRNLHAYMRLCAAEAAILCGDSACATRLLSELITSSDLALDHLGELFRVRGLLSSLTSGTDAARHFDRAERVFTAVGLVTAGRELQQNRRECLSNASSAVNGDSQLQSEAASQSVIESWLAIIDGLHAPEIVGRELLNIVDASGLVRSAILVKHSDGSPPVDVATITAESDSAVLNLQPLYLAVSQDEKERWELVAVPRSDDDGALALRAIQRGLNRLRAFSRRDDEHSLSSLLIDDAHAETAGMIVAAENMTEIVRITQRVASSNVTVLFTGETGTGKELLARALHDASPRRAKPFIPFNCTAVSRDMIDSQLFGYRRGAFTGALDPFPGVIRAAAGGTLFLDEIGEMPLDVQPKLLRFLESGEIHPLGEPKPISVDVRVVAATNANLEQLVAEGKFREDLFYRLNVVRLQVPALRERREEVPLLVHHFVDKFSCEAQKNGIRIAEETMEYLVLFKWPGNVRQLANEIRRMMAMAESGAVLMPEHLSGEIASSRRTIPASQRDIAPSEFVVRMDQPMSAATEHLERSMIHYAMQIAGGRLEDAAQLLGLSRKGLYLKRQRLKMATDAADGAEQPVDKLG
jgi:DNA-binding NtrC family response regulator